jgi:glycosyltransferase involved in cell wall biosynthesis
MKKLKILELTNYSSGICGVFQRVKQEAEELAKTRNYEVRIFSSNAIKGGPGLAPAKDSLGNIKIQRFPFKKIGGESFMIWNFEKEGIDFNPDVIIAHSYRHPHTTKALKLARILKKQGKICKTILVTHAPFIEGDKTRSILSKWCIRLFYDPFIGRKALKKFDKIITITRWEESILLEMGVKKEKIAYIPNGIPEDFFTKKSHKEKNKILFLGRIHPIKDLETLIKAVNGLKIDLDIVGPGEEAYKKKLLNLISSETMLNARLSPPVFDLNKKISLIDRHKIFILPSKTEAMPQSLIEAMSRGKICISSSNRGGKEIIENNVNGFIFEIGNANELKNLITEISLMKDKDLNKIRYNAGKTAEKFRWKDLIKRLESILHYI